MKTNQLPSCFYMSFKISSCNFELGQIKKAKKWVDVALKEVTKLLKGEFMKKQDGDRRHCIWRKS